MVEEKIIEKVNSLEEDGFLECTFEGCDFSNADFSKKRFLNCKFFRCNWTATKVENTRLQEVSFVESKVMGVDFTLCDPAFLRLFFEKCLLRGCNFTEMKLQGSKFITSDVKECHFVQSDLKKASFRGSNLEGTAFHHTNLVEVDFVEAIYYAIDPLNNPLKSAKFSKLEALALLQGLEITLE